MMMTKKKIAAMMLAAAAFAALAYKVKKNEVKKNEEKKEHDELSDGDTRCCCYDVRCCECGVPHQDD